MLHMLHGLLGYAHLSSQLPVMYHTAYDFEGGFICSTLAEHVMYARNYNMDAFFKQECL